MKQVKGQVNDVYRTQPALGEVTIIHLNEKPLEVSGAVLRQCGNQRLFLWQEAGAALMKADAILIQNSLNAARSSLNFFGHPMDVILTIDPQLA